MRRVGELNEEGKYRQQVSYEGFKAANEMMQDNNYDDYLETLDAYGKKQIKKKTGSFSHPVDPEVKSAQRIFGKGYWWWIFKQALYALFSGPFIWLKCLLSGAMDVWQERKKSCCVGFAALPFFIFFIFVKHDVFYILGGTPELVSMAVFTRNIHYIEGITTDMAQLTSDYIAYGVRGFRQWLIFLSVLFAWIGSRSFLSGYYKNKYELRKKADQSLPKADIKKRSVNLTEKEKKHYSKIERKLQDNYGDYAVERNVNDDYLASISRNLTGMFGEEPAPSDDDLPEDTDAVSESKAPASKPDGGTCQWRVIMEDGVRRWTTQCGVVRRYYDLEDHTCPYCKKRITF